MNAQSEENTPQSTQIEKLNPKKEGVPSIKVGAALIIPGALALAYAILKNSNTLAFIGLSLTFWGVLFFFIKPARYVASSMLTSAALSEYFTTDRILRDLKINGKAYYIPPYPKDVYLPQHLKGLKESVVFISSSTSGMPSIEELAKSKFLLENPNGICVSPPGLGLLEQLEKELKRDITKIQLDELFEILPPLITENLQLAKEVEIKQEDSQIYLKMIGSPYRALYTAEELKSIHFLGCPLASAIACAIAKASGKTVTVQKDNIAPLGQAVEVWYQLVEA
ncbi:MAG: hypothetical protein ACPLIG_00875 [Candidatus Bathyarchaeales archaeon]